MPRSATSLATPSITDSRSRRGGIPARASTRPPRRRDSPSPAPAPVGAAAIVVHDVLWEDPAAAILRASLAAEIRERYADRLRQPSRRPAILDPIDPETVSYTAVATVNGEPVGQLALRRLRGDVDLKRMYVVPEWRGRGVSTALLLAAEAAADRLGARRIVLQTGDRQPDAVHCYRNHGFQRIPNFGPYKAKSYSRCFAKELRTEAG